MDPTIDQQLLRATQDLLIEEGFERLSMNAVARRCGASKATIYRRWPGKIALVVAASAVLLRPPRVPDTGSLREDLLDCGRAYMQEGRTVQVLANVTNASRHDPELRTAFRAAIGSPYAGLFDAVLARAADRGLIRTDLDLNMLARIFPAVAYQQLATEAQSVTEDDVHRVVDAVLMPALGQLSPSQPPISTP